MKRYSKAATLIAALFCISLAAVGCGKGSESGGTPGPGGSVVGSALNPGIITPVAGGGGQIQFTGTNVYSSGIRLTAQTAGFTAGQQGNLILGAASVAAGAAGTLSGISNYATSAGTTIQVVMSQTSALYYSIAGVLNLSPTFMQYNYPQGISNVQGLYIDVGVTGSRIYGGRIYICDTRDQQGTCHGTFVEFSP